MATKKLVPPIVQRLRDTLNPLPLKKDYRALLDLGKSIRDRWALHLTRGTYFFEGMKRDQEEVRIPIDQSFYKPLTDYSIFYNPRQGTYDIQEGDFSTLQKIAGCQEGHFVGGFMIKGCELKFILPQNECIRYIRAFSKEFNFGYDIQDEYIDLCNRYCSEFNFEYNKDFETTCNYTVHDTLDCNTEYSVYEWFNINTKITGCQAHKGP